MKNEVNRAPHDGAKKDKFQSKAVPRGTRTIWRYLSALILLFTFAIGNVWAETQTYSFASDAELSNLTYTAGDASDSWAVCTTKTNNVSPRDGGFVQYKCGKSSKIATFVTTESFDNISNISFYIASSDKGKTQVKIEVSSKADFSSDVTEIVNATGGLSGLGISSPSNSTWYSVSRDVATKSGYVRFTMTASSSGKFWSFDDIVITYTPASGGGEDPVCPGTLTISSKDDKVAFLEGDKIELTAALSEGNGTITYQWYKGGTADENKLTGKTSAKLEIASCVEGDAGNYYCVASKADCSDAVSSAFAITVAHNPCHKYFYFTKAADATTAGVTNNESSFFTVSATGSNGTTGSITLDGTTYNCTNRTSNATTLATFTIPANKKGDLYGLLMSSGTSARGLLLDGVATGVSCAGGTDALHNVEINNITPGTHTLTADGNTRVGMFIMNVCDATFHTITLDLAGGTGETSISALDGIPATKPADPTWEHHRFDGWYNGLDAYDWSANVTGDLTLTAHWTQLYTVTYAAGDAAATGDAPTQADKAEGETFTVAANTFEVAGKDFVNWNDGVNGYDPDDIYTVGTANVVLTAQWKAAADKYTVVFKDGETELGSKLVEVGSNPSDAGIEKTKPLSAFAAWQKEGVDIALDDAFWATVEKDATVNLTARWTAVYALDVNFKDAATQELGVETALNTYHYASDASDISFEAKGLKIKTNAARFYFNVAPGKVAEIKFGNISGATYSVDGGAAETLSTSQLKATYSASAQSCVMTMTTDAYNIVENVVIHNPYVVSFNDNGGCDPLAPQDATPSVILPTPVNPTANFTGWYDAATGGNKIGDAGASYTPTADIELFAQWEAVSTDARLSAITLSDMSGVWSPAFDPEVVNYTYTMPYGTADVPTITGATKANLAAQEPVIDAQASAWGETAQVHGVAESGDTKNYYVQMLRAPKDGASIFKAELTSPTAATYSGAYADGANSEIKLADDNGKYKFSGNSNYIKMALVGGNFQNGDLLTMTYSQNPQQGELAIYDGTTKLAGTSYENHTLEFPVQADGLSTLYIRRTSENNFNGWVLTVEVTRPMNPLLETLSINGKDADVSSTDITMELATSTDLSNLAIVETYISNDNSQVTTAVISNSGNWVEGENTYRVTDKDGDYTDYTITISLVTPAVAPTIETDLAASGTYEEYSSAALSIVASSSDGGTLSYQWYKDDVAIEGAVEASYNVSEEGTYKVIVKNSLSATNYATATSTACVMTVVMPSGCDELASIPSAEPYQYVQTGEWTLYSITSGGKLNTTNKFKNNAKNFAGADVNAISDQRFAMKFDKNVEHVDFYATASSTRTWNGSKAIQVTEDDIAGSTVAYTDVTANFTTDLTTIVPTGTRQYIFRATGIFEAGKTYWFTFNGGLDVFRICYAEALEKPVLPTLSNEDICEGGSFSEMSVASASVSEGALSYQWYKDDEAIVGSEAATYLPTSAGTYYVVVTNSLLGRQPISAESNHAVLTASTSAVITTAPKDVRDDAGKPATLTVVAVGKNLHYAWKECTTIDGTYTDVAGAADAASLEVTVPEGVKYYKVVVSSDCGGDVEAIAKVEKWVALTQVDVTENTVWNWENAGENIKLTGETTPKKNEEGLMANIRVNGVSPTNDATFNSQALLFYGENVRAKDGGRLYASVGHISFHTTVQGIVSVEFSDNGSNNRRLSINGNLSESSASKTDVKTFSAVVPAGDVVLMGVGPDGTGENLYIRISKIEFMRVDYTRDVTVGRLGTICLPNGGKMYGADLYEVAYFDASAKKIFFDEILSGEMEAGVPYVFLPNGKLDKLAVAYTDELGATAGNKNGLYGSYTQEALETDGSNYILLNNQYCRVVEANTYVGAYRAYLKIGVAGGVPTNAVAPAPGRRRISMGVQNEQVATNIENVQGDEVQSTKVLINGQLFILRGEQMFDATGRLLK